MALAFLPLALARNSFQQLCTSRRFRRISRHHPNLNAFVVFVDNTYFNGRFQPAMWNSYSRNRRTRTNNYVEGTLTFVHLSQVLPSTLLVVTDNCYLGLKM